MQFPRASWIKPGPHLTLGRQRNDPWVFWHRNSGPQLWIPVSHSSISGEGNHRNTGTEHSVNKHDSDMPLQRRAEVSLTDLCNCCCQWAHNLSHSWPLSGNGTSPLCWCSALLPGSLRLPANTRWYLGVFESRYSLIVLSRDNMVLHFFVEGWQINPLKFKDGG